MQELDFGTWEGQPWNNIPRDDINRWASDLLGFAPPGGESGADLIARVAAFHNDIVAAGQDCIVVSHGGPLRVLAALLRGVPVDLSVPATPLGSAQLFTSAQPPLSSGLNA